MKEKPLRQNILNIIDKDKFDIKEMKSVSVPTDGNNNNTTNNAVTNNESKTKFTISLKMIYI